MKLKIICVALVLLIIYVIWNGYITGTLNHDYTRELAQLNTTPTLSKVAATPTVASPIVFTQEQLNEYYQTTKNPYVLHIRKALNGYLKGTNTGIDTPDIVIKKEMIDGSPSGLASFDKNYYKSKFVVYTINNSTSGGKIIRIIFQDKPDKVFVAWVYQLAGGTYDLRGFGQDSFYSEDKIKEILIEYKDIMEDKVHAV